MPKERERDIKKGKKYFNKIENKINTIFSWREEGRKGNNKREIYGRMTIFLSPVGERLMK